MAAEKIGRITQVIGAVLDIRFQAGELPLINEAIRIKREDGGERRTVQTHALCQHAQGHCFTRYRVLPNIELLNRL